MSVYFSFGVIAAATAPRHLKKAWLQRHTTGEDFDNNTAASTLVPTTNAQTAVSTVAAAAAVVNTPNKATNKTSDNNSGRDVATRTSTTTTTTTTHSININSKYPINNSNRRSGKFQTLNLYTIRDSSFIHHLQLHHRNSFDLKGKENKSKNKETY